MSRELPKSTSLDKTNMTADEMVPDSNTKGHNPSFWCLPPMREDPDAVVPVSGGYEFHLVTQGRQVGVWRSWTVAKSMVTGYPDAAHKGHHSYASCIREWQVHCQLGVHPHPPEPTQRTQPSEGKGKGKSGSNRPPRRSSSTPASCRTSGALAPVRGSRPGTIRYFVIWGSCVVHSSRYSAKLAFDDAVEEGQEPELLSTDDWEVALAYAEGDF